MGRRGPPRAPSSVTELRGGHNSVNKNYARPSPGGVVPSVPLSGEAEREWDRLVPDLVNRGVATHWDVEALTEMCETAARLREAREHLQEEGQVLQVPRVDRNGNVLFMQHQKNPWHAVWKDLSMQYMRLAGRFGLTPSDRAALDVKAANADSKSKGEDLLTG